MYFRSGDAVKVSTTLPTAAKTSILNKVGPYINFPIDIVKHPLLSRLELVYANTAHNGRDGLGSYRLEGSYQIESAERGQRKSAQLVFGVAERESMETQITHIQYVI